MKFTQDVCMDEKIFQTKKFQNWTGGRGTPHRPIFLTCMETTLKSATIFMKFTKRENFNPIGLATMQYCSGKVLALPCNARADFFLFLG